MRSLRTKDTPQLRRSGLNVGFELKIPNSIEDSVFIELFY